MHNRDEDISKFLDSIGWGDATRIPVPGDASTRRYERLTRGTDKAVLMDAPKASEAPSEPAGASIEDRKALGYNATARLAGADMESFAAISTALTQRGFSAPKIYGADLTQGFLLLEDFGDPVYARVITQDPSLEKPLYEAAMDTLAAIYRSSFPEVLPFQNTEWRVRDYDLTSMLAEMDLCLNWFVRDFDRKISDTARAKFSELWEQAFKLLDVHAKGLCLRDFHAENLFWLEGREATSRVGLIDFQDGLFVHPSYDPASLIEDIRRDVSADLTEPLLERFCDKAGLKYDPDFKAAYAVTGGQRNTKLLGFPVRADLKYGKPQYRALLPRVKRHFQNSLRHDALTDIRIWFETHLPEALK